MLLVKLDQSKQITIGLSKAMALTKANIAEKLYDEIGLNKRESKDPSGQHEFGYHHL